MKKHLWLLAAALTAFSSHAVAQTAFTAGDLVVERIGNGTTALTGNAAPVAVQEYSTSGTLEQTISLQANASAPSSAPFNLVDSGSASSDGYLNLSSDGKSITLPGYNSTTGTTGVASASGIGRTFGEVSSSGVASTPFAPSILTGNNFRSLISDGTSFWASGATGIVYATSGGATTSLISTNARNLEISGSTLYASSSSTTFNGSGSSLGIWRIGSVGTLPTAAAPTLTNVINTGSGSSPYDFAFSPLGDWAYVADDRANGSGGIQLWQLSGGSFTLQRTLGTGVANIGARGLAVDFSNFNDTTGLGAILYATTGETTADRLIEITDGGAGSSVTTLATAGTDFIFRGVDFAPVPEPSTYAAIVGALALAGTAIYRRSRRPAVQAVG